MQRQLMAWYAENRRDLPWRRTRDPYAILVSECMLQQTRVAVALPHYGRWMERFPTLQHLADAPEDDVLAAWSGLGYYRRARNLHEAARRMVAGGVPSHAKALRELPGIGPYTAGAVASIAFGENVPAVDGNVVRVLGRFYGLERGEIDGKAAALAKRTHDPGTWNQALMEFGALVCTPRPHCDSCPLAKRCVAPGRSLRPAPRPKRVEQWHAALVVDRGRVLMVRRQEGLLAGMWLLPSVNEGDWARGIQKATGVQVSVGVAAGRFRHAFTHRVWNVHVYHATRTGGRIRSPARWWRLADVAKAALPAVTRRALALAG
ncbi:MAG: A/G-specific adenine glycosylase [Thermoplasmatota archaeon]